MLLTFVTSYQLFFYFYQLLPAFIVFYQFLPTSKLYTAFHQSKMILSPFFHLLTFTNVTILLDTMLQTLILFYLFFACFAMLIFVKPSHLSHMIHCFRIIIAKIIIIKANIINTNINKTHIITKKCDIIRIFINRDYIFIKNTTLSRSLSILFVKKQSGTNFNNGR